MPPKKKVFESDAKGRLEVKSHAQQMLTALALFNDIESYDAIKKRMALQDCMLSLGLLFLEHFQFHPEEALAIGSAQKPLLQIAAKHLQEEYIRDLRFLIWTIDQPEQWERVCWKRSRLEAFNAMFGAAVGVLDLEEVEEEMQGIRHNFSIEDDRVPRNVPTSHWWWFNHFDE